MAMPKEDKGVQKELLTIRRELQIIRRRLFENQNITRPTEQQGRRSKPKMLTRVLGYLKYRFTIGITLAALSWGYVKGVPEVTPISREVVNFQDDIVTLKSVSGLESFKIKDGQFFKLPLYTKTEDTFLSEVLNTINAGIGPNTEWPVERSLWK